MGLDAAHDEVVQYFSFRRLVPLLSQQLHARAVLPDRRRKSVRLVVHLLEFGRGNGGSGNGK